MFPLCSQWRSSLFAHQLSLSTPARCSTIRPLLRRPLSNQSSRVERIRARLAGRNAKFPRFVQRWTSPILEAPAAQVISFLILHEITATVPLLGLVVLFEYTGWLPSTFMGAQKITTGMEKYGRWMRKKGWVKEEDLAEAEKNVEVGDKMDGTVNEGNEKRGVWQRWGRREKVAAVHEKTAEEAAEGKKKIGATIRGRWKRFKERASHMWTGGEKGVRLLME